MKARIVVSAFAVAALTFGLWPGSHNVAHAANTLSPANPVLTWTHGPFVVANPSDQVGAPTCTAPQMCDDTSIAVSVPSGTAYSVTVSIAWNELPGTEFDPWVYNAQNNVVGSNISGSTPETVTFPATSGNYLVRVDPWNPGGQTYTATVTLTKASVATLPPDAAAKSTVAPPRYQNYAAPNGLGTTAGEPSIGVDWKTGNVMYVSDLQTLRVKFDDSVSPARTTWTDVSAPNTSVTSLDPILYTDHTTGRTFVSELTGQDSLTAFTDTDGGTGQATDWTPSQGGGIPSGVDHQSVGGGPYHANATGIGPLTSYPDAVYYCSQDIETAFCARSDNGGLTFGPGVPIFNPVSNSCAGIHGHVKVAPDGTVYVPMRQCGAHQAVAVSKDNGLTWTINPIPDSTAAIGNDPSVGIGSDGTVYFGYQGGDGRARIAVSHNQGTTWTKSVDVGALAGVQNIVFPEVVAGDANRAAFAYVGSTTGGNFQSQPAFNGVWDLYASMTYDGGKTWSTTNLTPNDPVQRGSICISGTTCSNTPNDRNLLDFNDAQIDKTGHVVIAYADGCIATCVAGTATTDPTSTTQSQQSQLNSFTALATIARQSGGKPLFAAYDPKEPVHPARPVLSATENSPSGPVMLNWQAPDNGGAPITNYMLYRGTAPGKETLLASVKTHLSYIDSKVKAGVTYYYQLVAQNASGLSARSPEVVPVTAIAGPTLAKPACTTLSDASAGDSHPTGSTGNVDSLDIAAAGFDNSGGSNTVTAKLMVQSLNDGPGGLPEIAGDGDVWYVLWNSNNTTYFLSAQYPAPNTDPNNLTVSYNYGNITKSATGGALYNTIGSATGSMDTTKGVITMSAPVSDFAGATSGATLTGTAATTFESVGTPAGGLLEAADGAGPGSNYTLGTACS
jgi:hypothetical protein